MDAYDGGSDAPRGPRTSAGPEAETPAPPAEDAVPGPRAELPTAEADAGAGAGAGVGAGASDAARDAPAGPPRADAGVLPEPTPVDPSPAPPAERPAWPELTPPHAAPRPEPAAAQALAPEPRTGVAALSPRYQVGAALALAVVAVAVCVHLGMVFLHVAPSNTVTKTHGKAIDEWVYPEFEQNWKLFAPNPLQQNIAVQVRAQVRTADGGSRTTGWYDLSAQDGRAIDGNLVPSHTEQNELRRAWDFFTATHNTDNRSVGVRGALSETYLRRIVVLRLERGGAAGAGGVVERVQVRSSTSNVTPPKWSSEKVSTSPVYRVLSWWPVPTAEAEGGVK
ncbi:DUF5819 family protein [Streptomyces sp. NBC_01275]|uniref:DUF5819 family protein n=1 Tax=Streptomyces sp. NBC_01275 TaxID=2903807 RepID=UPI002251B560|nr:DUF5819 family protein [Streptomyces sp. NBC_01275]MCX4763483.1 DUF5819 family protein [Streptomyces sp. NBC_01275]